MTNTFGPSITLISDASIKLKRQYDRPEYFKNRFRYNHLQLLLNEFYEEIVENIYEVAYTHRIRPGIHDILLFKFNATGLPPHRNRSLGWAYLCAITISLSTAYGILGRR